MTICVSDACIGMDTVQVGTTIIHDQILPTVLINNTTVMILYGKAGFATAQDRVSNIVNKLQLLASDNVSLGDIQINRSKDLFIGTIHDTPIFTVTTEDAIFFNDTPIHIAQMWADQIKQAVGINTPTALPVLPQIKPKNNENALFIPMAFTQKLNAFRKINVINQPLFMMITIQFFSILIIYFIISRHNKHKEQEQLKTVNRIEELQNSITYLASETQDLAESVIAVIDARAVRTKRILEKAEQQSKSIEKQLNKIHLLKDIQVQPVTVQQDTRKPITYEEFTHFPKFNPSVKDSIYKLEQEGKSFAEIAKELNIGVGEVLLTVNLRNRN